MTPKRRERRFDSRRGRFDAGHSLARADTDIAAATKCVALRAALPACQEGRILRCVRGSRRLWLLGAVSTLAFLAAVAAISFAARRGETAGARRLRSASNTATTTHRGTSTSLAPTAGGSRG